MSEVECFEYSFDSTDLTSHMEDYIEQIEFLSRKKKVVRVKDIAKSLNIKMPSVTAALQRLEEKKLINYERYGYVELTEQGKILAERVARRHSFLSLFFHDVLRINKVRADKNACSVEHYLSPEACRQINKFIEFYKHEKKNGGPWIKRLNEFLDDRLLSDLHEGDTATILRVSGASPFKKRLTEMGFRKGEKLRVVQYAPLKDPLKISIKDYNISLRVEEAKLIKVKVNSAEDENQEE